MTGVSRLSVLSKPIQMFPFQVSGVWFFPLSVLNETLTRLYNSISSTIKTLFNI